MSREEIADSPRELRLYASEIKEESIAAARPGIANGSSPVASRPGSVKAHLGLDLVGSLAAGTFLAGAFNPVNLRHRQQVDL